MKSYAVIVGLVASVAAHGFINSPTPRMPGEGLKAACGEQVFNNQFSDRYGNIQGSLQNLQGDHPDCHMWQCKGIPFSDAGEIFSYSAGQVIHMKVDIRAPHDGVANVSIVKARSDKTIGSPLISWDKYALTSSPMSEHPEWTSFDIKLPDVSKECAKAGDCIIQWFWNAASINQTYESCIDFKMGDGSSSTVSRTSSASVTSAPAASSPTDTVPDNGSGVGEKADSKPTKTFTVETFVTWLKTTAESEKASGAQLPETFTFDTFISWLKAHADSGAANKFRRMIAARNTHPREFRV